MLKIVLLSCPGRVHGNIFQSPSGLLYREAGRRVRASARKRCESAAYLGESMSAFQGGISEQEC